MILLNGFSFYVLCVVKSRYYCDLLVIVKCYCLLVCSYIFVFIDSFFAVNDLLGYSVMTVFDSENKSILILCYL